MERTRQISMNQEVKKQMMLLDRKHFKKIRGEYNKKGPFLEHTRRAKERRNFSAEIMDIQKSWR
uniref:Uncharacterized protein n=1 Tax=Arion vulgaris TaxID=1028688 RepID=A0A0B7BCY8_9EUPU